MVKTLLPRRIEIIHNPSFCKGCGICADIACHRECWEMVKDDSKITQHVGRVSKQSAYNCTGCSYCELLCPDNAIHVKGGY